MDYNNLICRVLKRRVTTVTTKNAVSYPNPTEDKSTETTKVQVELDVLLFENTRTYPDIPAKDEGIIFILPEKREQYDSVNSDYEGESLKNVFEYGKYPTKIAKYKGGLYPISGIESLVEYLSVNDDDVLGHLEITEITNEPKGRVIGTIHLIGKNIDQFINRPVEEIQFRLRIHPILTRIIALDYVDPNGL